MQYAISSRVETNDDWSDYFASIKRPANKEDITAVDVPSIEIEGAGSPIAVEKVTNYEIPQPIFNDEHAKVVEEAVTEDITKAAAEPELDDVPLPEVPAETEDNDPAIEEAVFAFGPFNVDEATESVETKETEETVSENTVEVAVEAAEGKSEPVKAIKKASSKSSKSSKKSKKK